MNMIAQLAETAQPVLDLPLIRRVRRNHGLEHATIHILAQGKTRFSMAGRSDPGGFTLYGNVTTAEVEVAATEALRRMRDGQHQLAIHPNCGTNLLTTGVLASLAALASTAGTAQLNWRERLERFPNTILMVIGALIVAPPIGTAFQRHFTTLGEPGDLAVVDITRREARTLNGSKLIVHRVTTTGG